MRGPEVKKWALLLGLTAALGVMLVATRAEENQTTAPLTAEPANPTEQGHTPNEAVIHRPLPASEADVIAKERANRAHDETARSGKLPPPRPVDPGPAGEPYSK